MSDTKGDGPSSMESFSGSWIKLDSRNGTPSDSSPKLSDDEAVTEALADAQNEMSKSTNQPLINEEAVPNMQVEDTKKESSTYDFVQHPGFYVSALLISHSLAVALGVFIGRKLMNQSR